MTAGLARAATRPQNGSQQRAERTRARVIEQMVACVLEEGYAAASARRVAERAGVTWGVVQYHFGDRDGILAAVIEQGYQELVQSLSHLTASPENPDAIQGIVDAAWGAFSTDLSRAAFEILVATRSSRDPRIEVLLQALGAEVHRLGERLTGDAVVGEVLWATLRGLVLTRMMSGVGPDTGSYRRALAQMITSTVQG
jgi:AcrR family transcriptional regulator